MNRGGKVDVECMRRRAQVLSALRAFFDWHGFVEVETPVRIAAPAPEPHIDCPVVPHPTGGPVSYLRASPELQMKRLLAAGMDRIYQIGPCFREGEVGTRHNSEFTMIEWYRRAANYLDILVDCEELVCGLVTQFGCNLHNYVKGKNFKRIQVRDIYCQEAGWDPWSCWNQDRFDFDMATKIEPSLKERGPVFLMDYPPQAASLAKLRGDVAERWELYVDGLELANCFTELCDPSEQRRRFVVARDERRQLGEQDYPLDEEFLSALEQIDSAAGVALGVDRLVMMLLGAHSIETVRAFC